MNKMVERDRGKCNCEIRQSSSVTPSRTRSLVPERAGPNRNSQTKQYPPRRTLPTASFCLAQGQWGMHGAVV